MTQNSEQLEKVGSVKMLSISLYSDPERNTSSISMKVVRGPMDFSELMDALVLAITAVYRDSKNKDGAESSDEEFVEEFCDHLKDNLSNGRIVEFN